MAGLFIALFLACTQATGSQGNILLLSVDTLRADFLGCYGCPWPITPHLDCLARRSLVFDDAVCEIPLTAPSFTALFTSRYPRNAGVTRNGLRLPDSEKTVTMHLQAAGYYTFAVQSNWTLRADICGLNRGFDAYEDTLPRRRWGFYKGERHAEDVTRTALEMLKNRPADQPFFAWIHYSDPHAPYRYREEFSPVKKGFRTMSREQRARVKYASEVAYADHHIGKLLEELPENTRIIFLADHGESLYEHGYLGHGRYVYGACARIPLMICSPETTPGRTGFPAQVLDIGTTLLGLAGLVKTEGMLGRDLLHPCETEERPRFMETYGGLVPGIPGFRQLLKDTSPLHQAALLKGWKLVVAPSRPAELFQVNEDLGELQDLSSRHPEKIRELKHLLELWENAHGHENVRESALTGEDLSALQSLGYVE